MRRKMLIGVGAMMWLGCGEGDDSAANGSATAAGGVSITAGGTGGGESDTNGGASASGGETGGPGEPPPEEEEEADFRVPRASGRFVYTASEATDSVAVIDSTNLAIEVVGVGRGPTVVQPIALGADQAGGVAVLDQGSDDVALVTTSQTSLSAVRIIDITPGANNLAVAPGGRFVFAYHDVDGPQSSGPGSDQELTVIDTASDQASVMTVGAHPRAVVFDDTGGMAYVVTADGVNVVDLSAAMLDGKPDIVPVHVDDAVDPARLEVLVAGNFGFALARVDGDRTLVVTDLLTRAQDVIELPGIPTDIDISEDQSFAIITVPSIGGSVFLELALPVGATPDLREVPVPNEYVGLAQVSPDGQTLVLYTTQDPFQGGVPDPDPDPSGGGGGGASTTSSSSGSGSDTGSDTGSESSSSSSSGGALPNPDAVDPDVDPRLRVTIARRAGNGWDTSITLFVDRPVDAVGMAPDGANGLLIHEQVDEDVPFGYTLLDLAKEYPVKKLQTVEVEPGAILFTPSGDRAVVLLTNDADVRRVDQIDLRSFIVRSLGLGSPPRAAGYVDATDKVFVSQEHVTGRITFIDAAGDVQTITGFRLNDAVRD